MRVGGILADEHTVTPSFIPLFPLIDTVVIVREVLRRLTVEQRVIKTRIILAVNGFLPFEPLNQPAVGLDIVPPYSRWALVDFNLRASWALGDE